MKKAIKNSVKKCIVGVSGGMDSYILVKYFERFMKYEVIPVYFDYGSIQRFEEKTSISTLYNSFMNVDLKIPILYKSNYSLFNNSGEGLNYVPARNTLFIANLLFFAESLMNISPENRHFIGIGVTKSGHESFPDTRIQYIEAARKMVNEATEGKVNLLAPFVNITRTNVIRLAVSNLGVKISDLSKTYSCYKGTKIHCGECHACKSRREGMKYAGIKDLTKYQK